MAVFFLAVQRGNEMELKELLDMAATGVEKNFNGGEQLLQTAIAVDGNDELIIAGCPWRSKTERRAMLEALRQIFQQKNVKMYAFVSEAWVTTYGPGDDLSIMPMDSERRKEIVVISATDGVKKIIGVREILRPFDGPATLSEMKLVPEGEIVGGELLSLL